MLPSKIILVDRSPALASAWQRAFEGCAVIEVVQGDFFARDADAMVSPANSFGVMDGGLDRAIRDTLGFRVERAAQRVIVEKHHGELPVGQAEIVETDHPRWQYLIVAPTMRVPETVGRTLNAYLAFRAVLLAVARFNTAENANVIESMVCPGLGTGIGGMEPERCAAQMRLALQQITGPSRIPSFDQIHALHRALVQS